jgi:hypothetical protein
MQDLAPSASARIVLPGADAAVEHDLCLRADILHDFRQYRDG